MRNLTLRAKRAWNRRKKALLPVLALGALAALVILLWKVPGLQVPDGVAPDRRAELENEFRKTIAQIAGGIVLLVGVYATWRRVAAAETAVAVAQEGQITERFTRAVDQLGSENEPSVLGGIYALERIARDSGRDHWQVMEVLTAYVRSNAPWVEPATNSRPISAPIQAILNVLARRDLSHETPGNSLDLKLTDLRRANLVEAQLEGANLSGAHLEEAGLIRARLQGAYLYRAHLEKAYLAGAHLEGANLEKASGLTRRLINHAITDERTVLPANLQNTTSEDEAEQDEPDEAASE